MARRSPSSPDDKLPLSTENGSSALREGSSLTSNLGARAGAFAAVCWDTCGSRLLGLVVVRRCDSNSCFIDLPDNLSSYLSKVDPAFVRRNSALLLRIAQEALVIDHFHDDGVITRTLVEQGHHPSVPGTMRYIPADCIPASTTGMPDWQSAGYIVDVGEVDLSAVARAAQLH